MTLFVVAVAWVCGCGDDDSAGPFETPEKLDPAEMYGACMARDCSDGTCVTFTEPADSFCSTDCTSDDECPENPAGDVTCDDGHCRPYVCDSGQHLQPLGNGLICIRGTAMACASLDETPCNCGCGATGRCDTQTRLCVDKTPLGEECDQDDECTTGNCARGKFGGAGRCRKPAGETCNPNKAGECEKWCTGSADGTTGYCLAECEVYCGMGPCEERCEAANYTCGVDSACRPSCEGDDNCQDWEVCEFASIAELYGVCVPKKSSGQSAGSGGSAGGAGSAGASGMGGSAGSGTSGRAALGAACTEHAECQSGVCAAERLASSQKSCSVAPGSECFDNQFLCTYEREDGRRTNCFSNGLWSTCALSCDPGTLPCSGGFTCARLYQGSTSPPKCDDALGLWCMRSCSVAADCGDSEWTCRSGLCEPNGVKVQSASAPETCS